MKTSNPVKRRKFIKTAVATTATFSIVPSHVIAGLGHVAPSDKIRVANIGCGTQGLREMRELLQNPLLQVVSVCDPNKYSTNYIDWSPQGLINNIRETLEDVSWAKDVKGIPGGRDVAQDYVEKYYAKNKASSKYKVSSYEDFRELLEKEKDLDAVKIMTPDHLHAAIAMAAMKKGLHVITHKPIANRMQEARLTIDLARNSGVHTHLLAWSARPEYDLILSWIRDGVIGNLQEIHNWSSRPVWPQWTSLPEGSPPIPDNFNWDLWLGPVPHRAYHPNFTHNVFRGWYEFGGGSVADMGHYSLFPLFQTFGITAPPVSARAYGTTTRRVVDQVPRWVENNVAFPHSCMIKLKFPPQQSLGAFDLFWYDGGMKPFTPAELEADNRELAREGMLFVGDQGKILGGFRGEKPQILPASKMAAYQGQKEIAESDPQRDTDTWIQAILNDQPSPGSFMEAATVTETINLAAVALRAGKKIEYDANQMKITNEQEANKYLTRDYREGWELS